MGRTDTMRYTYDVYDNRIRRDTTDSFDQAAKLFDAIKADNGKPWVAVYDGTAVTLNAISNRQLNDEEAMADWRMKLEREFAWKPFDEVETGIHVKDAVIKTNTPTDPKFIITKPDVINPSHYQCYVKDMQWLEVMQYLPRFRDPDCFKAAVELQARKYLDRLGQKDNEVQELLKSVWYIRFLAAYIKNGNKPIRVEDIDKLLS